MGKLVNVPVSNGYKLGVGADFAIGKREEARNCTIVTGRSTVVNLPKHGISVGSAFRLTFKGQKNLFVDENALYYVVADGYTADAFSFSEKLNGSEVVLCGQQFYNVILQVDNSTPFDVAAIQVDDASNVKLLVTTHRTALKLDKTDMTIPVVYDIKHTVIDVRLTNLQTGEQLFADIADKTASSFNLVITEAPKTLVQIEIRSEIKNK